MIEFDNLKKRYSDTIQLGIVMKLGYTEVKCGNEFVHKFCENLVDNSRYSDLDKLTMKFELKILKEALSEEINAYYGNR